MARPYIAPFGFIKQITDDGATFTLSNPEDSLSLLPNTPISVWRYSAEQLAFAKIRGVVSTVGYVTAAFTVALAKPSNPISTPGGRRTRRYCGRKLRSTSPSKTALSRTPAVC